MNLLRRLTTSGFKTVITTLVALIAGLGFDVIEVSPTGMLAVLALAFILKILWKAADIDVEIRANDKTMKFTSKPGDSSRD